MSLKFQSKTTYGAWFLACILSSCYLPKASNDELIRPWLGQQAISLKTSYTRRDLKSWGLAIPRFADRKGWHSNEFYFPPGVEFRIEGIEVNRSHFSGPNIWILISSNHLPGRQSKIGTWTWGPKRWSSLTFEEQLMPQNFRLFFEDNPNFRFIK
jgi:hypothetical protein